MRNTRAIIHLENFLHNLHEIRKILDPGVKICISLKADAYGHGAVEFAKTAQADGADFIGIACPEEGSELRAAGITAPLLLYGLALPEVIPLVLENGISAFVADEEGIGLFEKEARGSGRRARLHLKVDTGMGRIGCTPAQAKSLARRIAGSPDLVLEGICTHFPASDERDRSFTEGQIARFRDLVRGIEEAGIDPGIVHASNSGGLLQYPEAWFSMVRPGILLYGYYPSKEVSRNLFIKPAMELRSKLVFIKRVEAGFPVSYGCTYRTPRPTWIGTVAAGYADGYPRLLSGRGRVLIRGRNYPIVGRVTMDQLMIDLGDRLEVERFDEAVLFGPDPLGPDAEEIADKVGTIPYEITCGINKRVPRTYVEP